jgi:hypothetical protein
MAGATPTVKGTFGASGRYVFGATISMGPPNLEKLSSLVPLISIP